MTPLLTIAVVLYAANAILFGFLSYVYGKTAFSTRAKYPLGLFVFSVLLLVQSAGTAAAYVLFGYEFESDVTPYMSLMASFEFVGVLSLLRITL